MHNSQFKNTMRRIALAAIAVLSTFNIQLSTCLAQTDVTKKYIDNPDFEARFAGWENGGMSFNTSKGFAGQHGMVFMEKWVSKGSKVGNAANMKQTLLDLPVGTYTLVATAQNIQQDKDATQTGAFLFAGNEQTEISAHADYSVTFTVLEGKAEIGLTTKSCTGNWVCIDNFRLYFNELTWEGMTQEMQRLIDEAESVMGDGVTGPQLQTAIDEAKQMVNDKTLRPNEEYAAAARALSRATLDYRIQNATGSIPTVTTEPFVPMGVTIALGRLTVKGNAKERGFCWSTEPEPTIFDNRSTRYFSNNGNIYCMEHLQPATIYYVRAYAITSTWQVAYGDVVKIATLPKGNVTTTYDNAGDEQTNYRIGSAVNEVKWLYDNLANIRGFNLSVHYSPGSGAGGGTADCSYGGWMRVSQNQPYQQTGTILHETNHGVGVGTTGEWYNNSNLRAETSRGLWLGPRANQVIKFLQNDPAATLTGDNTHMWPYGINGAHEDTYNPENTILYYGNVFTTHALHHDGLICSSSVGFATPAYVFEQDDNRKYYLTSEEAGNVNFLTVTETGALKMLPYDAEQSDNFAWHITYDPKTSYYIFQNVGTGRYLTCSNGFKSATRNAPAAADKFHLLPARQATTMEQYTGTGYWITFNKGANTLQANGESVTSKSLDFSNAAISQRWLFLSEEEMQAYRSGAVKAVMTNLEAMLANVGKMVSTPHTTKDADADLAATDKALTDLISTITTAKDSYTSPEEVVEALNELETAALTFLAEVKVTDMSQPIDLTWMLTNPNFDDGGNGWNNPGTVNYSCCEFYETTFDLNQTTTAKVPAGTYELRVQAYQRPGSSADTYTAYTSGSDGVKAIIYLKNKSQKVKSIWADAQAKSLGGTTSKEGNLYVPNNMLAASKWFDAGWYDNNVMLKTTTSATMKVGIRLTASVSKDWTIFDNFRLYYYGDYEIDHITGLPEIKNEELRMKNEADAIYDLNGRKVSVPSASSASSVLPKGIYIMNGKKVIIK